MTHDPTRIAQLQRRLAELEAELSTVCSELSSLDARAPLPGAYLEVELDGASALLPASPVQEVVRLVECTFLPDAPPWVLGSFLYRGRPVVAVDLGAYAGGQPKRWSIDAHVVILGSGALLGLLVDQVRGLVQTPTLFDAAPGEDAASTVFGRGALIGGLCRAGERVLPLLKLTRLLEALPLERAARP